MYRGSNTRIFPIIIGVVIIALVVASFVAIGRAILNSNSNSAPEQSTKEADFRSSLLNTEANKSVRWVVRGPIVADEKFQSYRIEISPSRRTFTVFNGYIDQVSSSKTYDNNVQAYEQFTHALDLAGISNTRTAKNDDIRGVCATEGLAFVFETATDSQPSSSQWTTTCKGSPGTMTAKVDQIQALFVNQIVDFRPIFNRIF